MLASLNRFLPLIKPGIRSHAGAWERKWLQSWSLGLILMLVLSSVSQAALISVRVMSGNDDAEEQNPAPGSMDRSSTALEFNYDDNTRQIIGIRFQDVNVPAGANVNSAYIRFTAEEADSGTTEVVINGEADDDASGYSGSRGNITDRTKTGAFVNWSIPAWNIIGETHDSPDLTAIIQEIVNRSGWTANNAMAFVIEPAATCNSSACERAAESYDGPSPDSVPLLVIDYGSSGLSGDSLILSTTGDANLGGLSFNDDDLVEYNLLNDVATNYIDGTVLFNAGEDIDAAHVLDNGHVVLSTVDNATIGGISIGDDDLVEYDPDTDIATIIFDGTATFSNTDEDIDAVFVKDDGNIVLSVTGNATIGSLSFANEDLIEYDPYTGIASLFFDGSAVYDDDEDTDAVHINDDGHILLSNKYTASINGNSFGDDDIVEYDPISGTATIIFDGGNLFSYSDEDIDAITKPITVSTTPVLIADWRLDETVWNGTPDEVGDSSGNGNHGVTLSGVQATTSGQVCGAAEIPSNTTDNKQEAIDTGVNVDDEIGNAGTISLWYRSNADWSGGGDRALFDASSNPIYFFLLLQSSGALRFGFEDTNDLDVRFDAPAQTFSAGQWVHIAVTWDLTGDSFQIFINGALVTTNNSNTSGLLGELATLYLGDNRDTYHPGGTANSADGTIDEWLVFQQVLSASEINSIYQNQLAGNNWDGTARICPTISDIALGFNCVEGSLDALTGNLYTKTVGQSFSFDVVALKDSDGAADAVETDYAGSADRTVSVELINTGSAAVCSAYPALSPTVSQSLVFTASDAGRKASAAMSTNVAYRSVGCRVTDNTDTANPVVGCSTDSFAARPTAITVSSNMSNSGFSGAPTAKAGANFTMTATATAGYDGTPGLDSSKLEAHAAASQTGSVSGTFGSADSATGIATAANFTYDEVGNFRYLAEGVFDASFTAIDQASGDCTNDFSNTQVGGKLGCKFGNTSATNYFGRFIPDHFILSGGFITNRIDRACAALSDFTYMDEYFQTVFTLSARNLAGNTTQNYAGAYAKLDLTAPSNFDFAALNIDSGVTNLTGRLNIRSSTGSWSSGVAGNIAADLAVTRLANPDGAYSALNVGIDPVDSDGVALNSFDLDEDLDTVNDHTAVGQTYVRYGRLNIANTHGSELLTLPVPLTAQYYSGSGIGFVTNTGDSCTAVAIGDLTLSNNIETGQTDGDINIQTSPSIATQASLANAILSAGNADLSLCPPGNPACTPGAGNTGYVDIEVTTPIYLLFDWFGTGSANPQSRASFGLFKGRASQIYLREVY